MTRYRSIAARALHILLALFFAIQGIVKLTGSPSWISRFQAWGYPANFHLVVGLAEVLGAVLLVTPRFTRFGALLLLAIMLGAAATHLVHREPQVLTTIVVGALLGLALITSRR